MRMTTAAQFQQYIERKKLNAYRAARMAFFEVALDVIQNTPVDEGFAKGSWTFSENSKIPSFNNDRDPQGRDAIKQLTQGVNKAKDDSALYLLSNLIYMPRLEYGWSMQAPNGMVRQALMRFERELERRLNEIR